MLYKLTKRDIFEDNPDLELIPEFAACTDRQLKFLFLSFDYESPFRQLSEEERLDKALQIAGYRKDKTGRWDKNARMARDGQTKSLVHAKNVFMAMQKNSDKFLLQAVRSHIDDLVDFIGKKDKSATQMEKANKFIGELKVLKEKEKDLAQFLEVETEELVKEEENVVENLSTLDRVNQEIQKDG